jgi:hypothetical protein
MKDKGAQDTFNTDSKNIVGTVTLNWYNPKTSEIIPIDTVHNTLTYGAADALAAAYGGDISYVPRYMGFAFVEDSYDLSASQTISRNCTIDTIDTEFKSDEGSRIGDVQVVGFSFTPTLSADEQLDSELSQIEESNPIYNHNVVTFHAHTVSAGSFLFDSDSDYGNNKVIPFALLLGNDSDGKEKVLARVSLLDGNGLAKKRPEGFELALDWKVTFV